MPDHTRSPIVRVGPSFLPDSAHVLVDLSETFRWIYLNDRAPLGSSRGATPRRSPPSSYIMSVPAQLAMRANVSSFSRANYLTERFGHCKDPLSGSEHYYRKSLHKSVSRPVILIQDYISDYSLEHTGAADAIASRLGESKMNDQNQT